MFPTVQADATARRPTHTWHWYAPRIAIALFVLALLGLLGLEHRQEVEENRTSLIRDVLWVEQNIQFGLEREQEQLAQLADAGGKGGLDQRRLEAASRHLLSNSLGLVQILVLDPRGELLASAPPAEVGPDASWIVDEPAHRLALATGKPTFGPPYRGLLEQQVDLFVPYYRGGAVAGTIVGVYGLKSLITAIVPWWLAEKHRVTLRDGAGRVVAAKSNVEARRRPELTHQVLLDPPGHGLLLYVESYGSETKLLRNALTGVIVLLAGVVLWNLWMLRRHVQRRLATEQALRAEHAFRKSMEDSLETGMRAVDLEGRLVYVNPAFCKMVGYSERELIGQTPPHPHWPPEEREHIEAALRQARARGAPRVGIELRLMRRGGERFDALLYESPLIDANGRQTGWMGSIFDISERKRARERTRQQEERLATTARLVTMGEMASTIAHELNQPLSAIASYTTGCLNVLANGSSSRAELEEALRKTALQAQRAGRIIRRVHDFVRKSEPTRQTVHIGLVVDEAVGFVEAEARKRHVRIRSQAAGADAVLQADPLLLQQVVLNLLRNGMDAMAATPPAQRELTISTDRSARAVTVRVADRGCGLSPAVREQLFEPFFTTKSEGMGMGLNICRSILELHQGRVWAEPNPVGGTVFCISLPLEPRDEASAVDGASATEAVPPAPETVEPA